MSLLALTGLTVAAVFPPAHQSSSPAFALDHVFLLVPPGGGPEIARLIGAGFTFDTTISRHSGGGTASRSALFRNAYLELLWVDSTVSILPQRELVAERFRRAAAWRSSGPSPIGVGLRRSPSTPDSLTLPGRLYTAEWMRPGTGIFVLGTPSDSAAVRVFVVPRYMALDAWVMEVQRKNPAALRHPLGVERLTRVTVHCPPGACPSTAAALHEVPGLRFVPGPNHLLELTFDNAKGGQALDLRPDLPLLIHH